MINRVVVGATIGAVAAAGAVGLALGYSGAVSLSRGAEATVSAGSLTYFACPDAGAVGTFQGGDRVYLTGRDEAGEWVQVRSPQDLAQRVWVQGEFVDPDEVVDLPVAGCAEGPFGVEELALDATTTTTTEVDLDELPDDEPVDPEAPEATTTTTTTTTATTTTQPGQTTTTSAPPPTTTTTAPTTTTTTTTTTTAPTTTTTTAPAPLIASAAVSPTPLRRQYTPQPGACVYGGAVETATLSATGVANANAVAWVARIGGTQVASGSLTQLLVTPGTWNGQIGPFPWTTNATPTQTVTVTVTASGPGGSVNRQTSFSLLNCSVPD